MSAARRGARRALAASIAVLGLLLVPAGASAAITSVFGAQTIGGGAIACTAQMSDGVRVCHGSSSTTPDTRLKSFDGQPLETYVMLPPAPSSGTDGNYPFIVQSHGYGSSARGPDNTEFFGPTADALAKQGYAVLQLTARGFNDSCGSAASRLAAPAACASGYIRLDDNRYEVRDIQYATGLLVDAGIVDPARIGVTGESYGGGVSLQLATLKDRIMNADGTLSPWTSPDMTPLKIAFAAPVIPWSDLVNSLVQNGRTLDYQLTSPTDDLAPAGVEKQSFVSGLFALGQQTGFYAPPGTNSEADLTTWYGAINAGEPYDGNPEDQSILTQIARYHSAYYLLDGKYGVAAEAPAPLLIANGFTDDLFPVDEAVRYYNLARSLYPSDPISLFDMDFGHQRGQNKKADLAMLSDRIQSMFDYYVKGAGAQPTLGATALTQTCPASAPSGGPYTAASWAALHPGEVDYSSSGTAQSNQTVISSAGDPSIAKTFDPVAAGVAGANACATAPAADQGAGVASYRLPAATGSGYTLLGAPTVIAKLTVTGPYPYLAARLLDVDPANNTETLVARGVYRIDPSAPSGVQVFQLHPGAWHFGAGHVPKLELLGQDTPYSRKANGEFTVAVANLQLRIPVHEVPDQPGTPVTVTHPKPPVVRPPSTKPGARCTARPSSRIDRPRTRVSSHGLALFGHAGEALCANASAATRRRQRIVRVWVSIYQFKGRRCRYLQANGTLSATRNCNNPLRYRAHGTNNWTLRLKLRIPRGHYHVRSDAVDGFGHHGRAGPPAFTFFTIR